MLGLDPNTVENERRPKRQAGREEARANRRAELEGRFDQGEAVEAALRAIIYVLRSEGSADERSFAVLKELHDAQPPGRPRSLAQLKEALREQSLLFRIDEARAVAAIPKLVRRSEDERARTLRAVRRLVSARGSCPKRQLGGSPRSRRFSESRSKQQKRRRASMSEADAAARREAVRPILKGHKTLVVGIANDQSIAYGCADAFRAAGAELAITWLNDKARAYVEPLGETLRAKIMAPLNVENPGEMEALFDEIGERWGKLDSLVHSIAFAPKEDLQGGLLDCSAEGFARAMDVSCHSFVRMAKLAAPLMTDGGTMFAMSYLGANRVVANYNVMGPVKAALEAACRYLAYELGPQDIRVHAISPGPLKTRAASGIRDFEILLKSGRRTLPAARAGRHR